LQVDPRGDEEGDGRVFRGGGWSSNGDRRCRVSNRDNNGPDIRNDDLGFRLASSAPREMAAMVSGGGNQSNCE